MLPLLLGVGRALLMGGGRAAAGGTVRGAIVNTFKEKAIDTAKDKAKDKLKKKAKTISTNKLLTKTKQTGKKIGKGGALVLKKSSSIVKKGGGALVKSIKNGAGGDGGKGGALVKGDPRGEIVQELEKIKIDFIKVKEISTEKLLNQKEDTRVRLLEQSKKKSAEQEADLEKKKDKKEKKKMGIKGPKLGLFDMIKNYLLNVFLGSLTVFLLHHGPTILKMFEDIGKGFTNVWSALKFGIITLTTVFPKQVKFLAKLTGKIIGPPAKLIGKLLLKAARVAGTLFKRAGGFIFNLIKGPLLNLSRRVGGEALEQGVKGAAKGAARFAGRAAGAAGNALGSTAKILKRFKVFSRIFKRVPVVGALIGIGIDLALGETLDRAVVGAIGSTLGAGIGAAIGQGLIPIPIVGAAVGGFVGAGIGDWAAKSIYGNLTGRVAAADKENPIERRAFGGSVNVRGGSSGRSLTKSASIQTKRTSSAAISPETLEKAKGTVLKDEKSVQRFANLSSAYGAIPFIGEAMKLGLDISLGEKVSKPRTDAVAETIGSAIGMALKNEEFSVPGFNKRIIGEFSKNLTIWAKRKVFNEVKAKENQFALLNQQKKQEERAAAGQQPGASDGSATPSGGTLPGNSPPEVKAMLEAISSGEGSWDSVNPGTTVTGLSQMTIADARRAAMSKGYSLGGSGAMGKWQQMPEFIIERAKSSGLNPDKDKFTPENQTKIARMLMASVYPGGEAQLVKDAQKDPLSAAAKLRGTWPSLPGGSQQNTSSRTFVARFNANISKYKSGTGGGYGFNHHKLPMIAMGGGHTITSEMGMRNFALSPGMHMGIDIAGRTGEPLQAFTDGRIEATSPPSPSAGYGNWVNWIDSSGVGHLYGHMNKPPFVKAGQRVKKGTILGELGSTGRSSGPHLHWEAATNPRDTGMPKSAVLSRFNPLSRYNKESPFGGSIKPDPSMASDASQTAPSPGSPGSSSQASSSPTPSFSNFALNYKVLGDPARSKGGRGGGSGEGAITWKEWGKYLRGLGFIPNENAFDPGKYDNSKHKTPDHGHNAMDAGWWKDNNYVSNTKKWEKIFAPLEGDAFSQVIGPVEDPGGHGNGENTHLHFTAKTLNSQGKIPLTAKLKALMGNPNPTATMHSGGGTSGSGGGGSQASTPSFSDFALNYKVIGDPAKKAVSDQLKQTASYDQKNPTIILAAGGGGTGQQPLRKRRPSLSNPHMPSSPVVNSYASVSQQVISSSMYKL